MLIRVIVILLISTNLLFANNLSDKKNCSWANNSEKACLHIIKKITNSSSNNEKKINRYIISRKEILEYGAIDLIDVLKNIPGVQITQSGPKGQQSSMFMRGTNSNHTLVLINGIAINDQSTTQGLHDFGVDFIQTIQQIEVYPGSSASQFGSSAIGGAINIILAGDYKDSFTYFSDVNNNYNFLANKSFVGNEESLNIKFGSVKNKTVSARDGSNKEKDKVLNYTGNLNYEKWLKNNLRSFNTLYIRQTIAEYDGSSANQEGYEGDNLMYTLQYGLNRLEENKDDNLILYYNGYDREYDEKGTIDNYYSNTGGLKGDLSRNLNELFSYGLGFDYRYDWGKFDNRGSYQASTKGHTDNFSIYSNIGWNFFLDSNVSLFLRNDNHKLTGNHQTYKVDLNKNFGKVNLGISHMTGLRNPTLYELFGTDNYGYSGNRSLRPEKSATNEIYTKMNLSETLDFSLTAFRSSITNNIEYVSNRYVNDTDDIDLNQSGLNSELHFKTKETNYKIFSSFLSSKKENGTNQLRRPRKSYGMTVSKKFNYKSLGDFQITTNYNHYGKHFDTHSTNFSTIEMDSTDLVDFNIIKKFNNSEFVLKITNLFDENYQRPHGYLHEGRFIKLGFRF